MVLALFFAAPRLFVGLLTSHQHLVELSVNYADWLVPTLLLGGLAYMYDGLFIGLTEGRALRNSMLISTLAVFLLAALVALWFGDNHLLWVVMVPFMLARTATLGWVYPGLLREYAAG